LPVAAPREILYPDVEIRIRRVVGDSAAIRGETWAVVGPAGLYPLTTRPGTVEPHNAARGSVGHRGGIDERAVVGHSEDRVSDGRRILYPGQTAERRSRDHALLRIELCRQEL